MSSTSNRKKIIIFHLKKIKDIIFFYFFLFFYYILYFDQIYKKKIYINLINSFSNKFNYNYSYYEINKLNYVKEEEVISLINSYLGQSVFLIPLKKISKSIKNLVWVENVYLSTNFKGYH